VRIEFDPVKSERNARERDLPFALAAEFDWEGALYTEDSRREYRETRVVSIGFLNKRLHVICFTPVAGGVRIISIRKANSREQIRYAREALDR
jgi:hypothetical protein